MYKIEKEFSYFGSYCIYDGLTYKYTGEHDFYASQDGRILRAHVNDKDELYVKDLGFGSKSYVNNRTKYYMLVGINLHNKCRTKTYCVHTLVMYAWVGRPTMPNLEIDHINNISYDNNVNNLRYCTHKENCKWRAEFYKNKER